MEPQNDLRTTPLPKTRRRLIFYGAIFFFLVFAPVVVLYALGYTFDFGARSIRRTGGIFIKANESGFRLLLNNEASGSTSFLSRGVLATELKPDLYDVRVEKDGFRPWQKFVRVEAEKISEFRSVFLLPVVTPEREVLDLSRRSLTITSLEPLPGSSWLMARMHEKSGLIYFFNADTQAFDAVEAFAEFRWDRERSRLLVNRRSPSRWALISLAASSLREERLVFPKTLGSVTAVDFSPDTANEFFIRTDDGVLRRFSRASGEAVSLIQDVFAFRVRAGRIYFVSGNGFFASADLNGENTESYGRKGMYLSTKPLVIDASAAGDAFVIDSGGGFFFRRRDAPEIMPVSGNIAGAEFTAGGDKVLFWSEHDLYSMWLVEERKQPFHRAGVQEKIISFPDAVIRSAGWFGDPAEHILFHAGAIVGITEIDTRGGGPVTAQIFQDTGEASAFDPARGLLFRAEKAFLYRADL